METTTKLNIYTSAATAVRCSCPHGWNLVDVNTSEWTAEEREELARIVEGRPGGLVCVGSSDPLPGFPARAYPEQGSRWGALDVGPPTVERLYEIVQQIAVAAAATRSAEAERRAEKEAEEEAERERILAAPVEALVVLADQNSSTTHWTVQYEARDLRPDAVALAEQRTKERQEFVIQALRDRTPASLVDDNGSVLGWVHGQVVQGGEKGVYSLSQRDWPAEVLAQAEAEAERSAAEKEAERAEWIAAHGSGRLQRCLEKEIECSAILRDEWLAVERPEWQHYHDMEWSIEDPRSPPEEALDLIDRAREDVPDATLHFWHHAGKFGYCAYSSVRLPGDYAETDLVLVCQICEEEDDDGEY